MKRIQLNEFIEARYSEFSLFFMDTLRIKTTRFLRIPDDDLNLAGSVPADQFVCGDDVVISLISGPQIRMTLKVRPRWFRACSKPPRQAWMMRSVPFSPNSATSWLAL